MVAEPNGRDCAVTSEFWYANAAGGLGETCRHTRNARMPEYKVHEISGHFLRPHHLLLLAVVVLYRVNCGGGIIRFGTPDGPFPACGR